MERKEYWYWLCNLNGIGIKKINAMLAYFNTPENIFSAKETDLRAITSLNEKDIVEIQNNKSISFIQDAYAKLKDKGIYFVTKEDVSYPEKLLSIYDAPIGLYVRGKLPDPNKVSVSVVGARNCSNYGREMALYFARRLSEAGVQIISGLARGVDGFAHQGALDSGKDTYGILGCGIDICYPASHIELYTNMQKNGGVISEYGLGMPAKQGNFPMRNRIISGLSDGILVIEAREKSGSLITVDMGLEQGKDIFAIPGRIGDELSSGCNNLIRMGAEIVNKPEDILDNYNINCYKNSSELKKNNNLLETKEKIVYACLSLEPKHINTILTETNIECIEVMEILINLELKSFVKQIMKNYYTIVV